MGDYHDKHRVADVCDLWTLGNEDRHGRTKTEQAEAKRAQMIREVEALYQKAHLVLDSDRDLFDTPLEQLVNGTTSYMFAWKANWEKCILNSIKRQEELDAANS